MRGDGRQRGEEMVKHEIKKKNIAAVRAWYHNTIPPFRRTILGLVSPWSGPPRRTGHRPHCDHGVNSCPMNTSNKALRLPYPFPPLLVSPHPLLLARPRLPLQYQKGILPGEGAIRGDEERHLHQQRRLVLRCVREGLADAPASGLHCDRREMASRPGCHGHLRGRRCRSLRRHCRRCCCWLRWRWRRGARCYDLFPFLLIYFLFCLSLCAAPCFALFAFLCACFIAYLCVVLGHILYDT